MGFAATFAVSLLGLVAFFGFKIWEIKRSTLVLAKQRASLDIFLETLASRVYAHILNIPQHVSLKKIFHFSAHKVVIFFANMAKFAEVKAQSLAMRLSRSSHEHTSKNMQASHFLREVGEHKNGLDPVEMASLTGLTQKRLREKLGCSKVKPK